MTDLEFMTRYLPLGGFLVSIGALTEAQVNTILAIQKQGDRRIFGEIAIDLKYIDDVALRKYIDSHCEDGDDLALPLASEFNT